MILAMVGVNVWLMPFLVAALLVPIVLMVGYYFVTPRMMLFGYKKSMSATTFESVEGGAGSIDIQYFTLYYDVRKKDLLIRGKAPDALHWQIGAFDGLTRVVDGAYVNHRTVHLNESREFELCLTSDPPGDPSDNPETDILDCSSNPRGMIIYRIVLANGAVEMPSVTPVG